MAVAGQDHLMADYNKALIQEITNFASECGRKLPLKTIYIGGGTPSSWPDKLLLDTFDTLRDIFDFEQISEITLEVNPGSVTAQQLAVWKKAGITRLSTGVQSLNDKVLAGLSRYQKAQEVREFLGLAQEIFENISVDLIIGLPGVSDQEWRETIAEVVTWPIKHISMYFLSIHENTPLYTRLTRNELTLPAEDPIVDLYYWTVEMFEKHGLMQYEISSFARPGFQSQHNQVYWDRKPYKGFGVGACSFDGTVRYQNMKNIERYIQSCAQGADINVSSERLTTREIHLEKVMLGLRRMQGLDINDVMIDMSQVEKGRFLIKVEEFVAQSLLTRAGSRVYLAKNKFSVENEVAVKLLE